MRGSPWNEGLAVSGEYLDHQIYLLLCLFFASREFDESKNEDLLMLRSKLQEKEICRILITISACLRNDMDRNPFIASQALRGISDSVGVLEEDKKGVMSAVNLSVRDAFNKIVHCDFINFDYVDSKARIGDALNPFVYLYGKKQNNAPWRAVLDIKKFANVVSRLT